MIGKCKRGFGKMADAVGGALEWNSQAVFLSCGWPWQGLWPWTSQFTLGTSSYAMCGLD